MTSISFWALDSLLPLRWLKLLNRFGEGKQTLRQYVDSVNVVAIRVASSFGELLFGYFYLVHKFVRGSLPSNR